jgi:hypothetical protein
MACRTHISSNQLVSNLKINKMKKLLKKLFENQWLVFGSMMFTAVGALIYQGLGFILAFLFFIAILIKKMTSK